LDNNKDLNGKGTLERFNECIGLDMDMIYPLVENLMDNLYNPKTCFDRYVPYLESMLGFSINNGLLYLFNTIQWRRIVVQNILHYYTIKGTKKGYEVLFNLIGISMELTESFGHNTFDSPITFDDNIRHFDTGCQTCSCYHLKLVGPMPMTDELNVVIGNIIRFNEPINARLCGITYNDETVQLVGDFNTDFNLDFYA